MTIAQLPSIAECRLWHVDLDAAAASQAHECLSGDESARAARFVFERDRRRYVAAHVALRETLSTVTGSTACDLAFDIGAFGKPSLAAPSALRFNLSHSAGAGLIAIDDSDSATEIGVDVEVLRPLSYSAALAAEYFTAAEQQGLAATAPPDRDLAFLTCWTRKEACAKALGLGLSIDTRSFEVGVNLEAQDVDMVVGGRTETLRVHSFRHGLALVCAFAKVIVETTSKMIPTNALIEREFA
ncbi:4'-phosphopantetheinyl transferase superfamily protein [Variovorax sp. PAMC28562]|uniref:4'-phosphopantetheinyl transferase family protein n=1 Tax=Variovorax sp. PAMC28562 TaxID=2762323 RepID=UPI00164D6C2D|nr:4'-phosphopantetheinyl transferase superfamily protein [Variovorax sp. PAMC28562]